MDGRFHFGNCGSYGTLSLGIVFHAGMFELTMRGCEACMRCRRLFGAMLALPDSYPRGGDGKVFSAFGYGAAVHSTLR